MPELGKSGNDLKITPITLTQTNSSGNYPVFTDDETDTDYVYIWNGRITVEIQNQSGGDIYLATEPTAGADEGRLLEDGGSVSYELDETNDSFQIFVVQGGAGQDICVSQLLA